MNKEIASLQKNHTWQLVEKPKDKKKMLVANESSKERKRFQE